MVSVTAAPKSKSSALTKVMPAAPSAVISPCNVVVPVEVTARLAIGSL